MTTTVADLVGRLRAEFLDDAIAAEEDDYRWPSVVVVSALNSAHKELARRLLLIGDSTTAETCQVTVAAGEDGAFPRTVAISPKVLRVDRLKFPGITAPLRQTSQAALDCRDYGWDEKTGNPAAFFVSPVESTITFNRQPVAGGTVALAVRRLPLKDFTVGGLSAGVPERLEFFGLDDAVCHAALKYLYMRDDKKTFDPQRASLWASQFEEDIRQIIRHRAEISPDEPIMQGMDW